jgi:cell division protein FtsZ
MNSKVDLPALTELRPRIVVVGVGGAGGNAVNNMIAAGLSGVEFIVANTDAQALAASSAETRIQLGANLTEGLGAGSKPEIGEAAAEEAADEIRSHIAGTHMLFIAAGMGGGTGTGAAGVIARIARDLGILTIAVVTKPFVFEGARRMRIADAGVVELKRHVDTLIVIPNQNLFRIANNKTTFAEAFVLADQVLYAGIAGIADLVVKEGLINLDLADVRTVLLGMGTAMMGTGEATGDRRATLAAEEAIANPLIDDVTLKGARALLLSIIGGKSMTLFEVDEIASRVRQEVDPDANIIVGATFDESLGERIRVSIVASGMARAGQAATSPKPAQAVAPQRATPPPLPAEANFRGRIGDALAQPPTQPPGQPPVWRGPGDVTVQDSRPELFDQLESVASQPVPASRESGYEAGVAFAPQPPVNGAAGSPGSARRTPPRMPEIDEFPVVGQREYYARKDAQSAPPVSAGPGPETSRKLGLFQKLTGLGGGARSADRESADQPLRAELPNFFGRNRRQG